MELLLKARADVNISTKYGYTALLNAVKGNQKKQVKMLIEAGADVNAMIKSQNCSSLNITAWENNIECAKLLLNGGSHVNIANLFGHNALETYIGTGSFEAHTHLNSDVCAEFLTLLIAAGETLDDTLLSKIPKQHFDLVCHSLTVVT